MIGISQIQRFSVLPNLLSYAHVASTSHSPYRQAHRGPPPNAGISCSDKKMSTSFGTMLRSYDEINKSHKQMIRGYKKFTKSPPEEYQKFNETREAAKLVALVTLSCFTGIILAAAVN